MGRRAVCVRVQHAAAGLRKRLLRQILPHLTRALLGPADHLRLGADAPLPRPCTLPHAQGREAEEEGGEAEESREGREQRPCSPSQNPSQEVQVWFGGTWKDQNARSFVLYLHRKRGVEICIRGGVPAHTVVPLRIPFIDRLHVREVPLPA